MEPTVITLGLTEISVCWVPNDKSDEFGRAQVLGPKELLTRWESGTSLISDPLVESYNAEGIVYTSIPLPVGTIIWRGRLSSLPIPLQSSTKLYKVIEYREVPDVKGRKIRLSAVVAETAEVLPEIFTPPP